MGSKEHLIKKLKEFFDDLNKDFAVKKIILFGSRISGKVKEESDVDLIIVSDDFERMNFIERAAKMYNYWKLDLPVDFLCYTSEEFNSLRKKISIVKEAIEKGVEVYA